MNSRGTVAVAGVRGAAAVVAADDGKPCEGSSASSLPNKLPVPLLRVLQLTCSGATPATSKARA